MLINLLQTVPQLFHLHETADLGLLGCEICLPLRSRVSQDEECARMNYRSPGDADQLSPALLQVWNAEIRGNYDKLAEYQSRFFNLDPTMITAGDEVSIAWFGDPAEPAFCIDEDVARELSDWGLRGRHELQNEYLEYHVTYTTDGSGKLRPKRVEFTTELREYWVTLAVEDPDFTRALAGQLLGFTPRWEDLYGVSDPATLNRLQRKIAFSTMMAGNGGDPDLKNAHVPAQPTGPLNTEHALFMSHPINGLDDLLYIVMFGAKPYSRQTPSGREPATKEQMFRQFGVEHLACRHADPRAATGAHDAVYLGKVVAFADPIGVYMASFSADDLRCQDKPVPAEWIRFSRGRQRLVFGPSDSDALFLDDIQVIQGDARWSLAGGYDLAKRVEVGPQVRVSRTGHVEANEYVNLDASTDPLNCGEAEVCKRIAQLKHEYEQQHSFAVIAPRQVSRIA